MAASMTVKSATRVAQGERAFGSFYVAISVGFLSKHSWNCQREFYPDFFLMYGLDTH